MAKRGRRSAGEAGAGEGRRARGNLSVMSVSELQRELAKRQRALPRLHSKRAKIAAKLSEIDREIAALGGKVFAAGAIPAGRKRPRNEKSLAEALADALNGQTMSVTDVAEEVQKRGYVTTSPKNFRTMVNQTLINSGKFKRVGRGQYTLK